MRSQSLRGAEKVRDDETSSPTRETRALPLKTTAIAVVNDARCVQAVAMDEPFHDELDQLRARSLRQGVIDAAE